MSSLLLTMACDEEDGPDEQPAPIVDAGENTPNTPTSDAGVPQNIATDGALPATDAQVADSGNTQVPDAAAPSVDDKGPIEGALKLTVVNSMAKASDVNTLVGVYPGTLGVWSPTDGKPTRYSESCSISVTSDGTFKVSASDGSISAQLNGDSLDTVKSSNRDELSRDPNAYSIVGNDASTVAIHVLRGYVISANSRTVDSNNNQLNSVSCYVRDPNPRTVRDGEVESDDALTYGGATAADLSKSFIGSYSNGSCTLTIGSDGTLRLVQGGADVSTRLAGDGDVDWGDTLGVFGTSTSLQAGTRLADGNKRVIKASNSKEGWRASARDSMTTLISDDNCKNLVKQ